jgi:hypothetical protein
MQPKSTLLHGYIFGTVKQIWPPYQSLDGAEKREAPFRGGTADCRKRVSAGGEK